ncbi:MAG: alpha/beta hydrolase [Proteobacteria bacterium]|nr:alpha/beta hydrolase [Pseudomonadota bacterium]
MADAPEARLDFVQCLHPGGLHRMAYWEWGEADNPDVVVCVHGLSRQGRDFDHLARALQDRFRVVCPDVAGRGRSDWLANPMHYQLPQYTADMVTLLARLNPRRLAWVGTSMGGLIGLGLAGLQGSAIDVLVLNDIGPSIAADGLQRIAGYVGQRTAFSSVQEAADYLEQISAGFGPHTPQEWLELTKPMVVPDGAGWRLHYDPRINEALAQVTPEAAQAGEQALWALYDRIMAPTLVLRGAESDILAASTAQSMTQRGPRADYVSLPGVGHAPTLLHDDQIQLVLGFLLRHTDLP